MKNKYLIAIILIITINSGFIIYKLFRENKTLKEALPSLAIGETIRYFDLISVRGAKIDLSALNGDKPSLIFIFSRDCLTCNQDNIILWKKLVSLLKNDINTYGIVLNDISKIKNFLKRVKLNFDVYTPYNRKKFIKEFRIRFNVAQTIICENRKIKFIKLGKVDGIDIANIIKLIKDQK